MRTTRTNEEAEIAGRHQGWASSAGRLITADHVRDVEAGGSNPPFPTETLQVRGYAKRVPLERGADVSRFCPDAQRGFV